jgi:REP element-mobilizing transposase RayT
LNLVPSAPGSHASNDDRAPSQAGQPRSEIKGAGVWCYCLMPNHVHLILVPHTAEALSRALGEDASALHGFHQRARPRMSQKKPAPDLIRGGHRFSERDMRKRRGRTGHLFQRVIGVS